MRPEARRIFGPFGLGETQIPLVCVPEERGFIIPSQVLSRYRSLKAPLGGGVTLKAEVSNVPLVPLETSLIELIMRPDSGPQRKPSKPL